MYNFDWKKCKFPSKDRNNSYHESYIYLIVETRFKHEESDYMKRKMRNKRHSNDQSTSLYANNFL